jgi:hypothetical protein
MVEGRPRRAGVGSGLTAGSSRAQVDQEVVVIDCVGRLTLVSAARTSALAAARAAAAGPTLARRSFAIAGGHATELRLHLKARARKLLARVRVIHARADLVLAEHPGGRRSTHQAVTISAAGSTAPQLTPSLLGAITARHGRVLALTALSSGRAVIDWYEKGVRIATGTARLARGKTVKVTMKPTTKGRRRLAHAKRLRLTARGTFRRAHQPAVVVTRKFTLTR